MEVKNCKSCGKIFNYISGPPICPACVKGLEIKFEQVKQYIYEHPGVNIQDVAEENEVSVQQIKKWVREERLSFTDDSPIGLECEGCGKLIKTGRYCNACKATMQNKLGDLYKEAPHPVKKDKRSNGKMRFLDN